MPRLGLVGVTHGWHGHRAGGTVACALSQPARRLRYTLPPPRLRHMEPDEAWGYQAD
jgi:hypothetical protein